MKTTILHILKGLGIFNLSRRLVSNKTLILAYHGFEVNNESDFDDQLFMKGNTLNKRLNYLKKHCNLIGLDDLNSSKDLGKSKVVITIDDGWTSTLDVAAPILKEHQAPYTVYLTTQNVLDNQPIFHIALRYILAQNIGNRLNYSNDQGFSIDLIISEDNQAQIAQRFEPLKTQSNDTALLSEIAGALQFDFDKVIENKALTLMSTEQVKDIKAMGADIQLHTHTHNTPLLSYDLFADEINVNRDHIEQIVGEVPTHHCYPSGVYNASSFTYLERLGVKTATTCYPGFCTEKTNALELPRFLDGENIPQIVFEAEVCGVLEGFRQIRQLLKKPFSSGKLTTALQ